MYLGPCDSNYDPRAHGARCDECPLKGSKVVPPESLPDLQLLGSSLSNTAVCVIGEAPGEQEERQERPFVGPSGEELNKALRGAQLNRRDVHVTNVMLCRPPGNKLKELLTKINQENRLREKAYSAKVSEAEKAGEPAPPRPQLISSPVECCAPRFESEIINFRNFITLGKTATHAVTGISASILAVRGGLTELDETETRPARRVMPTIHPAFCLRMPRWFHVFRNDVHKAGRWFRGESGWVPPKVTYNPDVGTLLQFLSRDVIFTFDIETDGIESLTARIRCIAIGDEDEVMVMGFLGKDGLRKFYTPAEEIAVRNVLREFFEDETKTKAGHNAGYYDKIVLQQHWGIDPKPIVDTILLHRCVESELPHGLAYVGSMYTDAPAWKCYDPETEVLTPGGWVKFPELEKGVPVAQWDEGKVSFVKPRAYVDQPYTGKMWKLVNQATDLLVSPDHKMVYKPMHSDELRECVVQALPKTGRLPHVGLLETEDTRTPLSTELYFAKLLVAFQADGSWMYKNKSEREDGVPSYLDFGFTKQRKIDRLKEILDALGMSYKETMTGTVNPRTRIWVTSHPLTALLWQCLGKEKRFGPWVLGLAPEIRCAFLDELPLWDGTKGAEHTNYNSVDEVNADWVQACAVVSGQAARKQEHDNMFRVSLPGGGRRSREWSKLEGLKREEIAYDGRIYCVSVPSGFLLVRRNGKVTVSGNTDREGNKLSHDSESDEQLHEYCANDVAVTARVLPKLVDQIRLRDQVSVWRMDQRIQAVCADMHTVGMCVDQDVRLEKEKELLSRRYSLLAEIRDRLSWDDFNPGSVYQVRDVLFDRWKLQPPLDEEDRYTSSGDPSTADLVLRSLLTDRSVPDEQREIIKLLRYYRKVQKVLGTYVVKLRPWNMDADLGWDDDDDWVDKETRERYGEIKRGIVDPRTGRMHPGYNAHVAVTGRLSSSKPINAQNFPKGLRAMVVAAPGHVLVGADMDQLELRIAAARWGVDLYLRAFEEGKDPHSMTAFAVFGDAFLQAAGLTADQFQRTGPLVGSSYVNGKFEGTGEDKKMRDLSKAVQYASQYMATVETVHKLICKTEVPARDENGNVKSDGTTDLPYALLPLRKVRKMRDNWLRGAPEFTSGWETEIQQYRNHGYIREDVTGRRRDFLDGEMPNEIVNFPIQASAAGLMNRAILQLHEQIPLNKWGPGTGIINQCHDSIVVECPEEEAETVAAMMEEAMNQEDPALPGVRFTASAGVGKTWKQVG